MDGVGERDGLERLWTPHRMAYIQGEGKPSGDGAGDGCPFCRIPTLGDVEGLIVARGTSVYAVLNLYPYNSGHLMVCPYRHVADYPDLTIEETTELAAFTQQAMRGVREASGAQGFNVGMNQGGVAGAGIAAHLHQHVVPRWGGDSNFMPVVGRTKVLPQLLAETRDLLVAAWGEEGGVDAPAGSELRWDAVTLDCRDPQELAVFWCALLGVRVRGTWEQYVGLHPIAPGQPRLVLQGTDDPRPHKNTFHLDLHVASKALLPAAVERAVGLGATLVRETAEGGEMWCVMADPEGNRFCLVAD